MREMDNRELCLLIERHFGSDKEFKDTFNALGGELSYSVLWNQKNGRRNLSQGWRSAYRIFFAAIELLDIAAEAYGCNREEMIEKIKTGSNEKSHEGVG